MFNKFNHEESSYFFLTEYLIALNKELEFIAEIERLYEEPMCAQHKFQTGMEAIDLRKNAMMSLFITLNTIVEKIKHLKQHSYDKQTIVLSLIKNTKYSKDTIICLLDLLEMPSLCQDIKYLDAMQSSTCLMHQISTDNIKIEVSKAMAIYAMSLGVLKLELAA